MRAEHSRLLADVQIQLERTPSSSDHLMLTRWRILSVCQYLLSGGAPGVETECIAALNVFAANGVSAASDASLKRAVSAIQNAAHTSQSVLPSISSEKRQAVSARLEAVIARGPQIIEEASVVLPRIYARLERVRAAIRLPGVNYRIELAAKILLDSTRELAERMKAAAALLYVAEEQDVIPDPLGALGMLDDDYALRDVLGESAVADVTESLYWSEIISVLWDDLPFLQGVNLERHGSPISISWLDRVNSYVAYTHVLERRPDPLLLLQPSIVCSPLHSLVSLIGLSILEALTSSQDKARLLRRGDVYEIDDCFVRFEGIGGSDREPGWIKLALRDCYIYQPPGLAERMVPITRHRLSSFKEFTTRRTAQGTDSIQRFFDWQTALTPRAISHKVVLVATHGRAIELLEGVESNGVRLLEHGLVRFVSAGEPDIDIYGTLLIVAPSLAVVRDLERQGISVNAILVDGYELFHRGRHDLPFLAHSQKPAPQIIWSATGYYPALEHPPAPLRRLEVTAEDLTELLELDDSNHEIVHASLMEAATRGEFRVQLLDVPMVESEVLAVIDDFFVALSIDRELPEYWQYFLRSGATRLRVLIRATPAEWAEVKRVATEWKTSFEALLASASSAGRRRLERVQTLHSQICGRIDSVSEPLNAVATAITRRPPTLHKATFVCERPEQVRAVESFCTAFGISDLIPVLLRELPVCSRAIAAGWISTSFIRRLMAHTPESLETYVDAEARDRWTIALDQTSQPTGESLLEAVGRPRRPIKYTPRVPMPAVVWQERTTDRTHEDLDSEVQVSCIFVWLNAEPDGKTLRPNSKVIVEVAGEIAERPARELKPGDKVILGLGSKSWSPADEFTEVIVDAIRLAQPETVGKAREWRRALNEYAKSSNLNWNDLQQRLAKVGVEREYQTLQGWLDLDHAYPIAPRGFEVELKSLWPLVGEFARFKLEQIILACKRLRSLRADAGRILLQAWKGTPVKLELEGISINELVKELRKEVASYEVEAVTMGVVPDPMIGWWVSEELAQRFETESAQRE